MRNVLAGCIVLLCATSAAAIDSKLFYLGMTGNDSSCLGVQLTIGGSTYSVRTGTASQVQGPTNSAFGSGSQVAATPRWYAGGTDQNGAACGGTTKDVCASKQLALGVGSGSVCTAAIGEYSSRAITYDISQYTSGGHTYWKIVFTSTLSGGGGPK
jgi:hypothetical protein